MNLDELTHLIVFARVVEESSFSEAARVLTAAPFDRLRQTL